MSSIQIVFISVLVMSLIYLMTISIIFTLKEKIDSIDTQIYKRIIIINIISLALEISLYIIGGKAILDQSSSIMPFFLILSKIFTGFICLWFYAMFKYTKALYFKQKSNELKNKPKDKNFDLIIGVLFLIILLLPTEFIIDNGVGYTSGMSTKFAGLIMTISCGAMVYFLIKSRAFLKNKEFIPIVLSVITLIIAVAVQMMNPSLLLFNPIITLVTIIMYHTIENPDVRLIEQLEIAREQADNANKAKTDFLSSMSHEIRTPLNAIVGFSDCITDASTLEEAKENAKDIVNASETLLEIVNGILDISKIESGKLEIVNSKYNAPETFLELAKLITPKMHEKGLEFTYSIAPDLPKTLFGDHANIKKVVTNLLSNACKYTERGFVHYEVNCVNSNGVSKLVISVEDSGRGIKKENVDKMFTKFQRLDEDRNTTIEGTGLGLAITKQLIELMGGRIILHTIYGEGSKFTVVLNQKIETEDIEEIKHTKTTLDLNDVRIMLVDDTPLNLKVAAKLMEKFNANSVDLCNSGFECIEKIKSGKIYDLIFLDDMMPKMSGVDTLKKLKEDPNFSTPTIALTANAITGMREKYIADGFNDYLAKPMDKNELIRVCNELLGRDDPTEQIPKIKEVSTHHVDSVYTEEQTTIIPVEENVEELLGNMVELGKNSVKSSVPVDETVNETNAAMVTPNYDVEVLDVDNEPNKEELIPVADINIPITNSSEKYDVEYLKKNGCDMDHALELLGDMEMYNMTVHDFLEEVDNKWNRINEELNTGDIDNYAIDVHSLKSDCKYLGFMGLADIAYEHELKGKEKDLEYCKNNFSKLEEEYNRVIEVIRNYSKDNPSE